MPRLPIVCIYVLIAAVLSLSQVTSAIGQNFNGDPIGVQERKEKNRATAKHNKGYPYEKTEEASRDPHLHIDDYDKYIKSKSETTSSRAQRASSSRNPEDDNS